MFNAVVTNEYVILQDGLEELAYWDCEEWRSDPSILPSIVNAVVIGYTEGTEAIRRILAKEYPEEESS